MSDDDLAKLIASRRKLGSFRRGLGTPIAGTRKVSMRLTPLIEAAQSESRSQAESRSPVSPSLGRNDAKMWHEIGNCANVIAKKAHEAATEQKNPTKFVEIYNLAAWLLTSVHGLNPQAVSDASLRTNHVSTQIFPMAIGPNASASDALRPPEFVAPANVTKRSAPSSSTPSSSTPAVKKRDTGVPSVKRAKAPSKKRKTTKKSARRRTVHKEVDACMHCGKSDSPEWRKGPDGRHSLCNACGLRYARKLDKERRARIAAEKAERGLTQTDMPSWKSRRSTTNS